MKGYTSIKPDLPTLKAAVAKIPSVDGLLQDTRFKIKKASFNVENALGVDHLREIVFEQVY